MNNLFLFFLRDKYSRFIDNVSRDKEKKINNDEKRINDEKRRLEEEDNALKADDDPLFYSADKPMILVRQAAKALGIQPVKPKPAPEAKAPKAATPLPKFITAEQVKEVWIKKLPQPSSLDKNYHKIQKNYKEFVADIKAGKRDLDAQETAATYNKSLAASSGHVELAQVYEAELLRISQEKQRVQQARKEREDFRDLEYQLNNINNTLRRIEIDSR